MDSKTFFQNCPATIIGLAGEQRQTTAAMLAQIFRAYYATTDLQDRVHLVDQTNDHSVLTDISNIDLVLYALSDQQLAELAVNVPLLVIGQTTDPDTNQAAVRSTNLVAKQVFYLGRDLNSYQLAGRTLAEQKLAFPDDLPFPLPELQVVGAWQQECAAAAALVASRFDFAPELIQSALASFAELPHHLDLIREVGGVKYYDDSSSTTMESALISLKAFQQPIVISTREFPAELVKRQIIVGAIPTSEIVAGAPLVDYVTTLTSATGIAAIYAQPGDIVLFVPADPSLTAEEFVVEVNKL